MEERTVSVGMLSLRSWLDAQEEMSKQLWDPDKWSQERGQQRTCRFGSCRRQGGLAVSSQEAAQRGQGQVNTVGERKAKGSDVTVTAEPTGHLPQFQKCAGRHTHLRRGAETSSGLPC